MEEEKTLYVPTGSKALDLALGGGTAFTGIPFGHIIELYGNEGTGKTTLALHIARNVASMGGVVLYNDVESALDMAYLDRLKLSEVGSRIIISRPGSLEQTLNQAGWGIKNAKASVPTLIVIDSIAALVPETEHGVGIEKESAMGLQARFLSKFFRVYKKLIRENGVALLCVNQNRVIINVGFTGFGGPKTFTPGGKALGFYATTRVELTKKSILKIQKEGKKVSIGILVDAHVRKNKLANPELRAEFGIIYGEGIRDRKAVKVEPDESEEDEEGEEE